MKRLFALVIILFAGNMNSFGQNQFRFNNNTNCPVTVTVFGVKQGLAHCTFANWLSARRTIAAGNTHIFDKNSFGFPVNPDIEWDLFTIDDGGCGGTTPNAPCVLGPATFDLNCGGPTDCLTNTCGGCNDVTPAIVSQPTTYGWIINLN